MRRLTLLLALLVTAATPAWAQSGKLSGRVVDETGEGLPGANVLIEGTTLGAATDLDGAFIVLNVPPGTYRVRVSYVGYAAQTIQNVRLASDQTAVLNVTLREEDFEGEEVVVTAERPVVDVTLTSSIQTVSREEIAVLPVQSLDDVVNLQAGVVDGHFRGGRLGEVQYQVDGVSINNPFDNSSSLRLDRSVLQEVQVVSGTFDAKYGQALSGVVNAVLRSGSAEEYEFYAESYLGDYASGQTSRYPRISNISLQTRQNYQATFSGPVPLVPSTTFLVNGQRYVDLGLFSGERRFTPTDSSDFEAREFFPSGDGAFVPLGTSREWSFLGKVSNRSIKGVQLDYQAITNSFRRVPYDFGFRFNPDGLTTRRQFSIVHGVDLTQTLSDRVFYTLSARQNLFDYKDMRYDDVNDPRYGEAGVPRGDDAYAIGAVVQGVSTGRYVQRTNTYIGKAEMTAQVTRVHLIEAGIEGQRSILQFGSPGTLGSFSAGEIVVLPDTLVGVRPVRRYTPVSGAAYIQDRIEWRDLWIRIGVRAEVYDANATVPSDPSNPLNAIEGAPASVDVATKTKVALAPRLGVSFPVTDGASVFFSYGHFYQLPGLGQLFDNADYRVLRDLQSNGISYGVLGNPDLDPEFTAQYEFGFKSAITRNFGLDLSLFYKDIRSLLGVEFVSTYNAAEYARLTNVDFGGVRGFTLALDAREIGPLTATVDYTLQVATGNASDARETATRAEAGEDPRPRQIAFNWDQRHTLNGTLILARPKKYAVTGIARVASGQPYTPSIGSNFGSALETNSGRKPAYFTLDLRAERFFRIAGMDLTTFARGFNLLDARYTGGFVFNTTGSPDYTTNPGQDRGALADPGRYAAPRRLEFGVSVRGAFSR